MVAHEDEFAGHAAYQIASIFFASNLLHRKKKAAPRGGQGKQEGHWPYPGREHRA